MDLLGRYINFVFLLYSIIYRRQDWGSAKRNTAIILFITLTESPFYHDKVKDKRNTGIVEGGAYPKKTSIFSTRITKKGKGESRRK